MKRIPCLFSVGLCLLLLGSCGNTRQEFPAGGSFPAASSEFPAADGPAGSASEDSSSVPVYQFMLDNALQRNDFDDSITYEDLARSPDAFSGTSVRFTGKIVQVIEGYDFTAYRFAVDNDYDKIIYVECYPEYPTDVLIEDDYATLSGVAYGMYSYETVLGNTLTIPGVLAAKFEIAEISLPEYPTGPLTLEKRLSTGHLYSTTEIESFSITDTEISYNGELHITCQVAGVVSGNGYLSLDLKCYDKDNVLIDTASIIASVSDGERFRVSDDTYIPADTSRIELVAD